MENQSARMKQEMQGDIYKDAMHEFFFYYPHAEANIKEISNASIGELESMLHENRKQANVLGEALEKMKAPDSIRMIMDNTGAINDIHPDMLNAQLKLNGIPEQIAAQIAWRISTLHQKQNLILNQQEMRSGNKEAANQ